MRWIRCVQCEKLWCNFVARTSSLIAQVQPILQRDPCSNETLPNAPKHYKMLPNMSFVPMGWIKCVLCEKFWCDLMAQTCALIAPVQLVLHRVSCSNEILPNAPKHYEMLQNLSLVPTGWTGAFFAKNSDATLRHKVVHQLHQFNPFCTEFHVVTKYCQMHLNTTRRTQTWV